MKETIENLININLPEDFETISGNTRESIYFLTSLENLFKEHVITLDFIDKDLYSNRIKRMHECLQEFEKLENIFYYPSEEQILPNGLIQLRFKDFNEYIDYAIEYIYLKEKTDELQLEILSYLFDIDNSIIDKIASKTEYLGDLKSQYVIRFLTYSAFEHSRDEDKFDNYRIYISNKKESKEYKKKYDYPIMLKCRNYDFNIIKKRKLYKISRNSLIEIMQNIPKLEEEKHLNEINKQQFKMSKKVNRLNYIAFIFAIIGIIYASISTYYLVKDHDNKKVNKIEKTLIQINSNIEMQNDILRERDTSIYEMKHSKGLKNISE